jgi:large subunit ribosomal protein L7/L12
MQLTQDQLLTAFGDMTLAELSEFRKAFEAEFDVTAAAAPAAAAAAPAAAEEPAEEQSEFDVILTGAGNAKIQVIKAVRALVPELGLADAKAAVDSAPYAVAKGVSKDDATRVRIALEAAGASVEVR